MQHRAQGRILRAGGNRASYLLRDGKGNLTCSIVVGNSAIKKNLNADVSYRGLSRYLNYLNLVRERSAGNKRDCCLRVSDRGKSDASRRYNDPICLRNGIVANAVQPRYAVSGIEGNR